MISTIRYFSIAILITGLTTACGGSDSSQQQAQQQAQQQQQREQARQDSMAQAKADSIAKAKADSMAKAQKQKEMKKQQEKDRLTMQDIAFNTSGPFSVQVGAWRSREKAEQQISTWKQRGFSNAYVVKYGTEETGNIWFRVRLGRVNSKPMAEKLSKLLDMKYNENSWISETKTQAS